MWFVGGVLLPRSSRGDYKQPVDRACRWSLTGSWSGTYSRHHAKSAWSSLHLLQIYCHFGLGFLEPQLRQGLSQTCWRWRFEVWYLAAGNIAIPSRLRIRFNVSTQHPTSDAICLRGICAAQFLFNCSMSALITGLAGIQVPHKLAIKQTYEWI